MSSTFDIKTINFLPTLNENLWLDNHQFLTWSLLLTGGLILAQIFFSTIV